MPGVAFCRFEEQGYAVFLVIKRLFLPFNNRNLFDSTLFKCKPAVDAIYDYSRVGGFIVLRVVRDPLNLPQVA